MFDNCHKCGAEINEYKGLPGLPIHLCDKCWMEDPISELQHRIDVERRQHSHDRHNERWGR